MLSGEDEHAQRFIASNAGRSDDVSADAAVARAAAGDTATGSEDAGGGHAAATSLDQQAYDCVLAGRIDGATEAARGLLADGAADHDGLYLINHVLVPALDEVGRRFEAGTLFLPQLMASAEAAKAGFDVVRTASARGGEGFTSKGAVVLATVMGDIHDIGKNIVRMLLENHGFEVIDLGRDVDPQAVADAVVERHVLLCGLSALMTTTVPAMAQTIELLRAQAPWCKVVVGGAVLTPEYARMVGADYYAKDAAETVRVAEEVCG